MEVVETKTIGEAWIESCKHIFKNGEPMIDEDKDLNESVHFVLRIKNPSFEDPLIEKYGDKEMVKWMMSNFTEKKRVPELKNSLSYGARLFDYNGKDQVAWVIEKIKEKPETKSATIPMLMPNTDTGYVPCVSMLDFKLRKNKLMIVAMCRSIDFGKKAYANMLALHEIQKRVADAIGKKTGEITMYVVSAHIYKDDYKKIEGIIQNF